MWGEIVEMGVIPSKMNGCSESHTKVSPKRVSFFAPLRLRVNPLQPHGAQRGLLDLTRRRKGAKKMARESDNFKEHSPFKKPRKSQEVYTESVYSLNPHDMKKWHNRCTTTTHRGEQVGVESSNHDRNIS